LSNIDAHFESPKRNQLIDFLRGLCLVVMTVDHRPHDIFEAFTWQTFGFISAAEGFVFLSGLSSGLVYGRVAIQRGINSACRRIWRRALNLYFANAALITFTILAAKEKIALLERGIQPGWSLWFKSLLCIEAPGYAEILRLYFFFFLLLPLVFWAFVRRKFLPVILVSAGLWLASALGYGLVAFQELGYFDPISWQLLFVAGAYFGFTSIQTGDELEAPLLVSALSFLTFSAFLLLRHWHFLTGHARPAYFQWLLEWRRTLPFARVLNFTVFTILVYDVRRPLVRFAKTFPGQGIAFLGRHSLQVFIWSVSISVVMAEVDRRRPNASMLEHSMITSAVLISCFLPAWLHKKWQSAFYAWRRLHHIEQLAIRSVVS
jgi:hypothetical protein